MVTEAIAKHLEIQPMYLLGVMVFVILFRMHLIYPDLKGRNMSTKSVALRHPCEETAFYSLSISAFYP